MTTTKNFKTKKGYCGSGVIYHKIFNQNQNICVISGWFFKSPRFANRMSGGRRLVPTLLGGSEEELGGSEEVLEGRRRRLNLIRFSFSPL